MTLALGMMTCLCAFAKKEKKQDAKAVKVELKTTSDSLSYTAGYSNTNGLIPFLQQQHKVDTAYMADFIQGLMDARVKNNDPRFVAYNAGIQIQALLEDRMISGMKTQLKDGRDSLISDVFYQGFIAALLNDSSIIKMADAQQYFQAAMQVNDEVKKENLYGKNRRDGEKFLAENSTKDSVITLPSGLQYKVIRQGNGPKPEKNQEVVVKYEGKLIDGTVFDSSYKRKGETAKFKCNQVIAGWTEALCLMPVGSKWELYIPQELAYGERQSGQIPPYSALIFTVELEGITGVTDAAEAEKAEEAKAEARKVARAAKKTTTAKK